MTRKLVCIKKILPLTFCQACVDNFCYNTNICIPIESSLKFVHSRKQLQYLYLISHVSHFYYRVRIYI